VAVVGAFSPGSRARTLPVIQSQTEGFGRTGPGPSIRRHEQPKRDTRISPHPCRGHSRWSAQSTRFLTLCHLADAAGRQRVTNCQRKGEGWHSHRCYRGSSEHQDGTTTRDVPSQSGHGRHGRSRFVGSSSRSHLRRQCLRPLPAATPSTELVVVQGLTHTNSEVLVPRPDYDFNSLEPAHAVFSVGAFGKPIGIQNTPLINFTSLAKTGTTPGPLE